MPNPHFHFKQFTIHQQHCAMKVTTDASLFGAVVASEAGNNNWQHILDIGAGTGLLSLMLAQKTNAIIEAVEIEADAYGQAKDNFEASAFAARLTIVNADINNYQSNNKYDLIITNPPFFEQHLQSADAQKNAAKHTTTLSYTQLVHAAVQHLEIAGTFAVLLPYTAAATFIAIANNAGLQVVKKVLVKQTPKHHNFRAIIFLKKALQQNTPEEVITIKDDNNNYTSAFTNLLKDYYLYL